jgi:hypothetical protein
MLARIAIFSALVVSLCSADNFIIKDGRSADSFFDMKDGMGAGHPNGNREEKHSEPMKVIVEDVNPNSDLGQAIRYVNNEAQTKELAVIKAKSIKKVVKKKKRKVKAKKPEPKPDDCIKPVPQEHVMDMSQMPSGEVIKAKEAQVVPEKQKDGHNPPPPPPKEEHPAQPKEAHAEPSHK